MKEEQVDIDSVANFHKEPANKNIRFRSEAGKLLTKGFVVSFRDIHQYFPDIHQAGEAAYDLSSKPKQ